MTTLPLLYLYDVLTPLITICRSIWNSCPDPIHITSILDTKNIDKKTSLEYLQRFDSTIPTVEAVVDSWDVQFPSNWNDSYQALYERVSNSKPFNDANELDAFGFYELVALQGLFLSTAISGKGNYDKYKISFLKWELLLYRCTDSYR
jgi:hypothetical protein